MKRLLLLLAMAGCAAPVKQTHHTAAATAPSTAPVTMEIKRAETLRRAADNKVMIIRNWIDRIRSTQ